MSVNQGRGGEYRKTGGASATAHSNNTFPAPAPTDKPSSAHRSIKKSNNAQGGQSRGNSASVNASSNSNSANGVLSVDNGGHVHSTIHGVSPTSAQVDTSAQMTSDSTLPSAPPKGDVGKGFALQFGSISPSFMNGMQVPPRTTSAPPNLDEQKHDQGQHDASKAMPAIPLHSAPKQHVPKKDGSSTEQQPIKPEIKRDVQVTSSPPTMQSQKPSINLPMGGMPMPMPMPIPMPFHQPPVPMQFGGPPNPQMPMQMPLPMANPPPNVQFMPGLQHPHLMQPIHQGGQTLGFNPQMSPHPPGSLGMNMLPQQQAVKFGSIRKSVKITHPETREELRLDNRDGGSRSHHSAHSQPVPSYTQTHPIGYYPNSHATGRPFFSAPSSHPLPSAQLPTSSPPPRFNYPPPSAFMNQSSNSFSNADFVHSVSTPVTVKPAGGTVVERGIDSNAFESTKNVEVKSENSSVQLKSGFEHSKQSDSINEDVAKKEIIKTDSAVDAQNPSGMKGQFQISPQGNDSSRDATDDSEEGKVAYSPSDKAESIDSRSMEDQNAEQNGNSTSDNEALLLSANLLEAKLGTDRPNSSLGSNKTHVESNKAKNNSGKKKRKDMLQKADALGTTSDLYMAYKGRDYNNESLVTAEETVLKGSVVYPDAKSLSNSPGKKKDEENKLDLEDWEDAADESPKLEPASGHGNQGDVSVKSKKYSRDFLLTISDHCTDLPEGFEVTPDIVDVLIRLNVNAPRDYPGQGRGVDRSFGGPRADRRGNNGMMDVDRWGRFPGPHPPGLDPGLDFAYGNNMMGFRPNHGVLRHPRPIQHVGGILSGPMGGDRWQRATNFNKGLMPYPQIPLQAMHKAERKYEIGKVTDEEQAKQRRLKAILNKLTPQNFEKLFEQVQQVNVDNAVTLTGVISQIFDKALMEPTFCEMYANFCSHLAMELPDLSVENEKITFRRLLLNKCQEEFERGEREEEEANKADDDGEGETKQSREEKRLKARRRMLGNIRLIGELYKKRMLTERIMHECIKKLLGQYQEPDEENIEALCKLMSTIGDMIDHPKAKEHMDAYFDIMLQLSNNMKLSSRVRFMLRDSIDLRKNKWQQRRKVEGPKKIEEVHRDAAQERQGQARSNRGQGIMNSMGGSRRGQIFEYAPRGSVPGGGFRGGRTYAAQDARMDGGFENNKTVSVPLPQRSSGDEPITLGPQGGLAKGMAYRGPSGQNGHSVGPASRNAPEISVEKSVLPPASEKMWPEERLHDMSIAAIKEYYSANDENEVALCIKDLNAPSFYPTVIAIWVTDAFERKDKERDMLANLLVSLANPPECIFNTDHLIQGFESVLTNLEDTVNDAPRAPEFLGRIFGRVITEKVISLKEAGRLIHEGGEEPGRLLEAGLAADILGSILEMIKLEKGDSVLNEIRTTCDLILEDFRPPDPTFRSKKLEMFI